MRNGYTLIEILVVVAIVGIVLAVAGVKLLPDDRQALETEAERLALLLELGRDTAASRGRSLAWVAREGRYVFLRQQEDGEWRAEQDEQSLRERALPEGMRIARLSINHVVAGPAERLVFTPSGANAPFEIVLALGERRMRVTGNALGRVEVGKHGEPQG